MASLSSMQKPFLHTHIVYYQTPFGANNVFLYMVISMQLMSAFHFPCLLSSAPLIAPGHPEMIKQGRSTRTVCAATRNWPGWVRRCVCGRREVLTYLFTHTQGDGSGRREVLAYLFTHTQGDGFGNCSLYNKVPSDFEWLFVNNWVQNSLCQISGLPK